MYMPNKAEAFPVLKESTLNKTSKQFQWEPGSNQRPPSLRYFLLMLHVGASSLVPRAPRAFWFWEPGWKNLGQETMESAGGNLWCLWKLPRRWGWSAPIPLAKACHIAHPNTYGQCPQVTSPRQVCACLQGSGADHREKSQLTAVLLVLCGSPGAKVCGRCNSIKGLQGWGRIFLTVLGQSLSFSKISLGWLTYFLIIWDNTFQCVYKFVSCGLSGMVFLPGERGEKINKVSTWGVTSTEI